MRLLSLVSAVFLSVVSLAAALPVAHSSHSAPENSGSSALQAIPNVTPTTNNDKVNTLSDRSVSTNQVSPDVHQVRNVPDGTVDPATHDAHDATLTSRDSNDGSVGSGGESGDGSENGSTSCTHAWGSYNWSCSGDSGSGSEGGSTPTRRDGSADDSSNPLGNTSGLLSGDSSGSSPQGSSGSDSGGLPIVGPVGGGLGGGVGGRVY